MLKHLEVTNVALIEEARVDFAPGLNILSGETGAGKSIVIDSIGFVLGGRMHKDFIRTGAESASVTAYLSIAHDSVIKQIANLGVDIDCDRALLIYRTQSIKGRSVAKANGKPITIGMLKSIAALLIDVHGQHEHQSLLDPAKHLQLIDRFCQDKLAPKKDALAKLIARFRILQKTINEISGQGANEHNIEMYKFQIEEIKAANLNANEEERLIARRKTLANAQKISHAAKAAANLLNDDGGVIDNMSRVLDYARQIETLAPDMEALAKDLDNTYAQLTETSRDFARYADTLDHSQEELEQIEQRLDAIYRLKQKYNKNIAQILEYFNDINQKLKSIENSQEELEKLAINKKALEKEIGRTCIEMSIIRKEAAKTLQGQIELTLRELGMQNARFAIEISNRGEFGPLGFDKAEFMISANIGEELKALSAIASGGEMSRVMLALKTALSNYDTIETFIFDEIDTGISGRTAQQVAEKLSIIGKNHQILCITHLPQIAAMGDSNFLIEKNQECTRTFTYINHIQKDDKIKEIARLIGGAEITPTTLKASKEMISLAKKYKLTI